MERVVHGKSGTSKGQRVVRERVVQREGDTLVQG